MEIINVTVSDEDQIEAAVRDAVEEIVEGVLDDLSSVPLRNEIDKIEDRLEQHHQEKFDTQTASDGTPWAKLKPATIRRKGHATILFEMGDLRASEASQNEFSVRDIEVAPDGKSATLTFGTNREGARAHQFGFKKNNLPARPHLGVSEPLIDEFTEQVADSSVTAAKRGKARR